MGHCSSLHLIMNLVIIFVLAGTALAAPSKEAVALDCGEVLTLNDREMMDVEFESERGITGDCEFTIEGPKDYHVEVACEGGSATVDGEDATNYHGPVPAVIKFNLESEEEQIYCRVGLEEEHEELSALHGRDGTDTNIQEFEAAFNIHEKNETYRAAVLAANEKRINEINADRSLTWRAGVTSMADKTEEEMQNLWTGRAPPPSQEEQERRTALAERDLLAPLRSLRLNLPESVDLTTIGRVSPAKNQGNCGSCSIFASVSTIESCFHKATGVLPTDLSEQHLMDCAYGKGGNGCNGGLANKYHKWMYENHNGGLANEADYPYREETEGTNQCENKHSASTGAKVTSHQESWSASEEDIMTLLAAGHSVTTGIYATGDFQLYRGGIFQDSKCQNCRSAGVKPKQNHDIVIVGYGVQNGVKYWKLKNSWASTWGENGFGKILRGVGHCCLGVDYSVPLCTATGTPPAPAPAPAPTSCKNQHLQTGVGVAMVTFGTLGYPSNYENNQNCDWTITVPAGQKVMLQFDAFVTEYNYDKVTVYEGSKPRSYRKLGTYDGDKVPSRIVSKGNTMLVTFTSDGSGTKKGFKAIAGGKY